MSFFNKRKKTPVSLLRGGDDRLLSGVAGLFESYGFRLLAAHEVAPEILVRVGPLGKFQPSARDNADIERGLAAIDAIGPLDIGQAVVVADGRVLALEAAEGTDLMLDRIAELRKLGRIAITPGRGVLVKAPKRGQDRRFDLPTVGPMTINAVQRAGLAGIALVAGAGIVAEPQRVAELADAAGVFVIGVPERGRAS